MDKERDRGWKSGEVHGMTDKITMAGFVANGTSLRQVAPGQQRRASAGWRMNVVAPTSFRVDLGPLTVSPLGVGAWSWGDEVYWGSGTIQDQMNAYEASISSGINLFDTAEVYALGESERRLGRFKKALEAKDPSIEPAVLATKFGPLIPFRYTADGLVDACKASVERLGVDSIDLYQLHWPGMLLDSSYWDGIAKCYEKGLIKAVGVSNYGPKRLMAVHKILSSRGVPLVTNQVLYSLAYRKPETELMELCDSLGIKILAYSPLAQGLLTGKYNERNLPTGPRGLTTRAMLVKAPPLLRVLQDISDELTAERNQRRGARGAGHTAHGVLNEPISYRFASSSRDRTMAQVSLNWIMCKGAIPIPGAKNKKQADENAGALGWTLTEEEIARLDEASAFVGDIMVGMPIYNEIFVPS